MPFPSHRLYLKQFFAVQDINNIQLGPGTRSGWAQGSGSQRLSRKEEPPMPGVRNMFDMLNLGLDGVSDSSREHSEDRYDSRRGGGPSRSMVLPSRESRESSKENDRLRAIEAVRFNLKANHVQPHKDALAGGPTASMGPPSWGRPVPENRAQVISLN